MRRRQHLVAVALLLLAFAGVSQAAEPSENEKKGTVPVSPVVAADFVRRSCRSTSYPRVCESTLLPCAPFVGRSPRRLARAALVVGADRASNCSSYIRGSNGGVAAGSRGGAMKDCAEMARDAEERLRQSAAEMERMGRAGSPRFAWRLSNVQTWASAALTDTSTCLDSLLGQEQEQEQELELELDENKDAVRRRVVAVAQATSNALALVNKLE